MNLIKQIYIWKNIPDVKNKVVEYLIESIGLNFIRNQKNLKKMNNNYKNDSIVTE